MAEVNQRQRFVETGVAMPDGRFPIATVAHLRRAVLTYDRARPDDKRKLLKHIKDRAEALNAEDLPWVDNFLKAKGADTDANEKSPEGPQDEQTRKRFST